MLLITFSVHVAVKSIKKQQLVEVRSLTNPPKTPQTNNQIDEIVLQHTHMQLSQVEELDGYQSYTRVCIMLSIISTSLNRKYTAFITLNST